ncbi:hypothetical protein BC940DRAFT_265317 [Gongronella butleri]|nr:hypothetical protein BC940DRAFT_265317 [Gongronella butleri]
MTRMKRSKTLALFAPFPFFRPFLCLFLFCQVIPHARVGGNIQCHVDDSPLTDARHARVHLFPSFLFFPSIFFTPCFFLSLRPSVLVRLNEKHVTICMHIIARKNGEPEYGTIRGCVFWLFFLLSCRDTRARLSRDSPARRQ